MYHVVYREKSQLLTDPHDVNLTDNQPSIHDKLYQYIMNSETNNIHAVKSKGEDYVVHSCYIRSTIKTLHNCFLIYFISLITTYLDVS